MGAGDYAAGAGLAGLDPVGAASAAAIVPLPLQPPRFDLATRRFLRNADGTMATTHWVDQAVALAIGVQAGGVTSDPLLGNRLRKIKRAGGPRLIGDVKDAITVALADLITRSDIAVTELTVTTPTRGQILIVLSYVNLRLAPQTPNAPPQATTLNAVL